MLSICLECGKAFIKKSWNQKCCSKACKVKRRKKYLRKFRKTEKKNRQLWRRKMEKLVGNRCVVCGTTKNLCFHEIHGKSHPNLFGVGGFLFLSLEKGRFVPICRKHHGLIHLLISNVKSEVELKKMFDLALELVKSKQKI